MTGPRFIDTLKKNHPLKMLLSFHLLVLVYYVLSSGFCFN
jgi:hypothetical protein